MAASTEGLASISVIDSGKLFTALTVRGNHVDIVAVCMLTLMADI